MQNIIHISDIDNLSGRSFELFTGDLLKQLGYSNITVTKYSGDKGLDVIAEDSQGEKIGIQCKHLAPNESVGYHAIEEAYTGRAIYHLDTGIVLTNQRITNDAIKNARKLHIRCWNRNILKLLIDIANNSMTDSPKKYSRKYLGKLESSVGVFAHKLFLKRMPCKIPCRAVYRLYLNWCYSRHILHKSYGSFKRDFEPIIKGCYIYKIARIGNRDFKNLKNYLAHLPSDCKIGPARLMHIRHQRTYRCYKRIS